MGVVQMVELPGPFGWFHSCITKLSRCFGVLPVSAKSKKAGGCVTIVEEHLSRLKGSAF